nr:DUF2252 domain-containing protein [Nocardioides panaciterrulae]
MPTPQERADLGRAARERLPHDRLGRLDLPADRTDLVAHLEEQAPTRLPELVPLRHARMSASALACYRGAAATMAGDLAAGPTTGLGVQLCGDAHLSNFGLFASPERRLLFDLNDFDETYPGPFEWDLKRLTASLVLAGRANGLGRNRCRKAARAAVRSYRDGMADFATRRTLEVWYARAEVDAVRKLLQGRMTERQRRGVAATVDKARRSDTLRAWRKLAETVDGRARLRSDPPLVVPVRDLLPEVEASQVADWMAGLLDGYAATLREDHRALLGRFGFVDLARKVVGVGSVGTRCWIVLLQGRDAHDPLLLQVKEAQPSVLAPVVPADLVADVPRNEGERVVAGQRLMQAASDVFLGWQRVRGLDGQQRDFYVRQLRDMKGSAAIERLDASGLRLYAELCGWTLARAHARSGDPVALAAYLGRGDAVPEALAEFAGAYADLAERDHAALVAAIHDGRVRAEVR